MCNKIPKCVYLKINVDKREDYQLKLNGKTLRSIPYNPIIYKSIFPYRHILCLTLVKKVTGLLSIIPTCKDGDPIK